MKKTPRLLLAALTLALCAAASAVSLTKGSGDLADPATFGGALPSEQIQFARNGSYTIGSDVTFYGLRFDLGVDVSIDASAANPAITMSGPGDGNNRWQINLFNNARASFKGGIYDFKDDIPFRTRVGADRFNGNVVVLDACVFTNMGLTSLQGYSGAGNSWTLQNGSKFHINARLALSYYNCTAPNLELNVLSGSSVSCTRFQTDENGGSGFQNHRVVVSGAGSSFVTTGVSESNWSAIGNFQSGASLLVDNGASVDFSANDFYIGLQGTSVSNTVTISGGATAVFNKFFLGGWVGTDGNSLRILDGASVTAGGIRLTGDSSGVRNSELVVSNATLTAVKLMAPNESGKGYDATIRIQGSNPKISITSPDSNACEFIRNTTLVFDVPPGGWTNTTAIMSAPAGGIYGDATATIRVNGMEECFRKMKAKAIIPLMASTTGAQFPASVLEAANAAMPAEVEGRCTLCEKRDLTATEQARFPSAHSRDLFLRIKPLFSTTLYIR